MDTITKVAAKVVAWLITGVIVGPPYLFAIHGGYDFALAIGWPAWCGEFLATGWTMFAFYMVGKFTQWEDCK